MMSSSWLFLNRPKTIRYLWLEGIKAVKHFQDHMRIRENKLGNHVHMDMDIHNCNKACTLLRAESMNSCLKSGLSKVHSNMDLDRSTQLMLDGINAR